MKAAEENGRAEIVRFLLRNGRVQSEDRGNAFVAAAANGHVAVAEVCLDVIGFSRDAPIAAAANNQVPVLRLLMQSDPNARSYFTVIDVLEKAVEGGNVDTSELLIEAADEWSIKTIFKKAAVTNCADVLSLILERCTVNDQILASMLRKATNANRCEIVELVLERCQRMERDYSSCVWNDDDKIRPTDHAIVDCMEKAADKGQLDLLQTLLTKGAWNACDILGSAVLHGKWEVVRLLLQVCDKRYLEDPRLKRNAAKVLEKAAADDDVEMAELLFTQCGVLIEIQCALTTAVQNNSKRIYLSLLRGGTRLIMVDRLLAQIDQEAIEEVLERAATHGNVATATLLLTRCNPVAYKRIFRKAAICGSAGIVQLLLAQMDCCSINRALISAATRGYTAVVNLLVGKADAAAISCALEVAAMEGQLQVIELLRNCCNLDGIRNAVAKARVVGCDEVVALLSSKKARRE